MKEFATSAVLMIDGDIKTYDITYIDASGREITVSAEGINMVTALQTVIKQRKADRLKSVPTWIWLLVYMLFTTAFAIAAIKTGSPLMLITGVAVVVLATKMLTNGYFKFVK